MNFTLEEIGEKIEISDIEEFESEYNVKLPKEYRTFLLKNNGGDPEGFLFTEKFVEIQPGSLERVQQATDVERFFSLKEMIFEYEDIVDDEYILPHFIPIARTSFGNLILISVSEDETYGSVNFSNHDLIDDESGLFVVSVIKNTFSEFIDSLHVEEL